MKGSTLLVVPDARRRAGLQRTLGRWFREQRRDLPWRRSRDPYAIWISEAMLQQTRVETVLGYYARFLERFPTVAALAEASEDQVLALWSGLGYYSRARSLHRAARGIVAQHGGELPRTREEWLALPGVGAYTAGAVLSIAFGQPEAAVDGNVQRVFARLFALEDAQGSPVLARDCWTLARALVPAPGGECTPGDWNQALMELGARVCTPRSPACASCPVRRSCVARAAGREHELPRPRARPAVLDVRLEILVARRDGEVLLVRRPAGGRMAGLWEFPTRECLENGGAPRLWPAEFDAGLALEPRERLGDVGHTITRHRIRAEVRSARRRRSSAAGSARWVQEDELGGLGLSGLARKVLRLARGKSSSSRSR